MPSSTHLIESWTWDQEANEIELLSYLGSSPLAASCLTGPLQWVITGVFDNTWNGVVRTRLDAPQADVAIAELLARFRSCLVPAPSDWYPGDCPVPEAVPVPFQWYLPRDSQPEDLARWLEAQGCRRLDGGVGMGIDLDTWSGPGAPAADGEIRPVRDPADLARWCAVSEADPEARRRREIIHASLSLGPEAPYQRILALSNGEPAGASSVFLGRDTAGIYDVKVPTELRNRGIGTAVTVAALEEGRVRGYHSAVLGPSPEGAGMYRRIGFRVYPYQGVSYVR